MVSVIFGKGISITGDRRRNRFSKNIWRQVQWKSKAEEVARTELMRYKGRDTQTLYISKVNGNTDCREYFGVKMLSNVDKDVKEITRYKIPHRKRDEIMTDLMMKALEDRELRLLRDQYENRRATTNDEAEDPDGEDSQTIETWEMENIDRQIKNALMRICWKGKAGWVNISDPCLGVIEQHSARDDLLKTMAKIEKIVPWCTKLDVSNIVRKEPFKKYGNCILCYWKGRKNTSCRRYECKNNIFGRVMNFTNGAGYYINPDLLHTVMSLGFTFMGSEDLITEEDGTSEDVCLPLQSDEYILDIPCVSKLLWYARMYEENDEENLKHVMNEVVTTYDILYEIYRVYEGLIEHEKAKRSELWLWCEHKGRIGETGLDHLTRLMINVLQSPTGMTALKVICANHDGQREEEAAAVQQQQEHDRERANLVPDRNNNDVQDINNIRRRRDDDNGEERNVRPRWGVPPP